MSDAMRDLCVTQEELTAATAATAALQQVLGVPADAGQSCSFWDTFLVLIVRFDIQPKLGALPWNRERGTCAAWTAFPSFGDWRFIVKES